MSHAVHAGTGVDGEVVRGQSGTPRIACQTTAERQGGWLRAGQKDQAETGGARDCAAAHTNSGRGDWRKAAGNSTPEAVGATEGCATLGTPTCGVWVAHQSHPAMFMPGVELSDWLAAPSSALATQAMPVAVHTSTQPAPLLW